MRRAAASARMRAATMSGRRPSRSACNCSGNANERATSTVGRMIASPRSGPAPTSAAMLFLCVASCSSTASRSASALDLRASTWRTLPSVSRPFSCRSRNNATVFERTSSAATAVSYAACSRASSAYADAMAVASISRACAASASAALASDVAAAIAARLRPQKSSCHENVSEALA